MDTLFSMELEKEKNLFVKKIFCFSNKKKKVNTSKKGYKSKILGKVTRRKKKEEERNWGIQNKKIDNFFLIPCL